MFKIGVYTYSAAQNIDKVLFFTFGSQEVSFYAGTSPLLIRVVGGDAYNAPQATRTWCSTTTSTSMSESLSWRSWAATPRTSSRGLRSEVNTCLPVSIRV